jgi:F0F1-type ATP synthase membrane subunit b/b'
MGKLTEFLSKGARLIVTDTGEGAASAASPPPRPQGEIPAEALEVPARSVEHSEVAADVTDFAAVYQEAGIDVPEHGYGIDKIAEMLENKRFATLAREAKATAVMVALEAAGVPVRDVIQDAVRRDKALDAFEADKEREIQELKAKNEARIQDLNRQLEQLIEKINAEVQTLKQASETATRAFAEMQLRRQKEEERLHGVVAHFIEGSENPITKGQGQAPPPPPPAPSKN